MRRLAFGSGASLTSARRALRDSVLALFAIALWWSATGPASAQQERTPEGEPAWSYRLAPYLWLPTVSGELRGDGADPPAETETSLLDLLDSAVLIVGEARTDRWGLLGEFNYLDLSAGASTDGTVYLGAEAGLQGTMASLAANYRVFDRTGATLDLLAGVRAWWLDLSIDYRAGSLPAKSVRRSNNWIDPIVGLRGSIAATDTIFLTGLVDFGGFGVGSDLQWEADVAVGYRFGQTVALSLGYRHLAIDFRDGGILTDVSLSGPYLMLDFTF